MRILQNLQSKVGGTKFSVFQVAAWLQIPHLELPILRAAQVCTLVAGRDSSLRVESGISGVHEELCLVLPHGGLFVGCGQLVFSSGPLVLWSSGPLRIYPPPPSKSVQS